MSLPRSRALLRYLKPYCATNVVVRLCHHSVAIAINFWADFLLISFLIIDFAPSYDISLRCSPYYLSYVHLIRDVIGDRMCFACG